MKIKVLPCPSTIIGLARFMGEFYPEDYFGDDYTEVKPVFNRPGWYYNRETKDCWIEVPGGRAFKADAKSFLYEINTGLRDERPLLPEERAAIRTLAVYGNLGNNRLISQLLTRLHDDDCFRMLQEIKNDSRKARFEMLKSLKRKNKPKIKGKKLPTRK